jgi:hypothetical protein
MSSIPHTPQTSKTSRVSKYEKQIKQELFDRIVYTDLPVLDHKIALGFCFLMKALDSKAVSKTHTYNTRGRKAVKM